MKHLMKALAIGSALAALAPLAHADPLIVGNIYVTGADTFNTTTITFPSGEQGVGYGSTLNGATVAYNTPVTFTSPITYSPAVTLPSSGVLLAQITSLGLNFYATTYTSTYTANDTFGHTTLDLKGLGYFTEGGYAQTPVSFDLLSTEPIGSSIATIANFNANSYTVTAATPEPSSLILLGTGVLGAAGMLRRRFSGKSKA